MKKIGLLILGVTLHLYTLSQSPAGFSYQGVLRNTEGQVLANKTASLIVSLTNSSGVDVYYSETHSLSTNALGLFSLVVGQGTVTSGALNSIPWSQGGVYLKLDVKPDGATYYVSMGIQQLQAVPYALYAADGLGINWLGELSVPPADPVKNQAYYNSTDKKSYIWDGDSWEIIAMDGFPGLVGEVGPQGSQGIPGVNGVSISWVGSSIAAPASPDINNAYYNSTDKKSYIWDGDSWEIISMDGLQGSTGDVGPQGPQGIQGIQGEAGPQGIQGEVGPKGDQGVQGEIGPQGPQGLQGEVGPEGPRGPAGVGLTLRGNWCADSIYIEGDYVFDESSSTVGVNSMWICQNPVGPSVSHPKDDSSSWVEFEAPEGPQGPQGPEGPLVAGISGQTLRHDGTTWVANSMLYNNGTNIGIGTTAPDKILTVKSLTTNTQIAKFADDARYIGIGRDEIGSYDLSGNLAGLYLNQGKLYVGSNGNVGVGTTNPGSYRLYVHGGDLMVNRGDGLGGNIRIAGHSFVGSADWGTLFLASGTNNGNTSIRFITENAERMYVIGNGNVGIGAWPSHRFHVSGGNGVINNVFMGDVGHGVNWAAFANSSSANTTGYALLQSADGLYTLLNRKSGAGYIGFRIDNIDQMVIANSGYVGIGTNGPDAKLKIENGGFAIGQGSATNDTYGGYRTIQLSTQNGINGGTYDNHTGALLWSTLESGGWGDARLKIALGTNWGVYNTANPAMVIGQNFLGVGTSTAGARMVVQGSATAAVTEPLFEVKDKNGNSVFIVYQDSVRIIVKDGTTKDSKGIFAVSGRNTSKALTNNFLMITPDKARIWTDDETQGFAAENINGTAKEQYTKLTPSNSLIGHLAGLSNTGTNNTYIGTNAGRLMTSASNNIAIGSEAGYGSVYKTYGSNVFIGNYCGREGTGLYNVMIGNAAGQYNNGGTNIFIGNQAGQYVEGSNNVLIGSVAGGLTSVTLNNQLLITGNLGNTTLITGDFGTGRVGVMRNATARTFEVEGTAGKTTAGDWLTNSDYRIKTDIQDIVNATELIKKLHPVKFKYSEDWKKMHPSIENRYYYNFIAQEYQVVFPDAVKGSGEFLPNDTKEILSLDTYDAQIVTIKAVQNLIQELDEQKNIVEEQRIIINELIKRIEILEKIK